MFWNRYRLLIILLIVAAIIRIFSLYPEAVESYYAQGIYPYIAVSLRFLFGWIPFSFGDILYGLAIIYLIKALSLFIRRILQKRIDAAYLRRSAKNTVLVFLWVYILFNGLWGLNYNRHGIAKQLGLEIKTYTVAELESVINLTIDKLHQLDTLSLEHRNKFYKKNYLFSQAIQSYERVEMSNPFLEYYRPSVKPSIFSYLGNYLGYSGYYNPFTGEAQVNTTVPVVLQPFVTSHEIGHQLGFARENEANFAGYLATRASADPMVRYSIYFDLYIYAYRNLAAKDSTLARSLHLKLPLVARDDLRNLSSFYSRYENPLEPVIRKLYGHYLKANEQPQGILSYDEVIAWVIAYWRKYGVI
ncbi:MAG TPA: DUF3810 domain-containing protein [Chitinophagaceae bacterium]